MSIEFEDTPPATGSANGQGAESFRGMTRPLIPAQTTPETAADSTGRGDAAPISGEVVTHQGEHVEAGEDLGPILPSWLASREVAMATIRAKWRKARWYAARHAVRSPVYAARWTVRAIVGLGRSVKVGWIWAFDLEGRALWRLAKEEGDHRAAMVHETQHRTRLRTRGIGTLMALGAGWAGLDVLSHYNTLLPDAVYLAAFATLVRVGRPVNPRPVLADLAAPTRVDLRMDYLNDAFRAAGLLAGAKGDAEPPNLVQVSPILRDGKGWAVTFDLPRGGGKNALDVLAKRETLAAELGIDEIQLMMGRVRAVHGGNAGRVSMWVADDDPYIGEKTFSPLIDLDEVDFWKPVPLGRDARGRKVEISLLWQSVFWGGLPRRGKTWTQRLVTAAGILDPYVQHYIADFKGGADWTAAEAVAHRLILGAEDDALAAFDAMLDELLVEMERRFRFFRTLPTSICPEGKLTREISVKYNLPLILITLDELQEAFTALDKDAREECIKKLCRIARRGPAAGLELSAASQRPDAESVPTKLREIITYRYSTQVIDKTSSDMVLGKGKAAQGADASALHEDHVGVGVLVTGPATYITVKADLLEPAEWTLLCQRGRALRVKHNQLTGDAAGSVRAQADAAGLAILPLLSDVLDVMRHSERMHTKDLLAGLANLDEDSYGDWDSDRLAAELDAAGVNRLTKQVKINGVNLGGYRRTDIEDAVPVELLDARNTPPNPAPGE